MGELKKSSIEDCQPLVNLQTRVPELDGLRGLAISIVLFYHFVAIPLNPSSATLSKYVVQACRLGWSGVDLFFVLSGFLIGGILLDAAALPRYFKVFYIRRACRILPLYLCLLVLFAALTWLSASGLVPQLKPLVNTSIPLYAYATFIQNFWMATTGSFGAVFLSVTWSLAIEEQFYLTLPLIIRYVSRKALLCLCFCVISFAPLLRIFIYYLHWPKGYGPYVLMPCRVDALAFGVLVALLLRSPTALSFMFKRRRMLALLLLSFSVGILYFALAGFRFTSFQMISVGYSWFAIFYALLLLGSVIDRRGLLNRLWRNRLLIEMGYMAYGLYLFHLIINWFCHVMIPGSEPRTPQSEVAVTSLAFLLTIIVSRLSWIFLEKPLIRCGHSLKYQKHEAKITHLYSENPFQNNTLAEAPTIN